MKVGGRCMRLGLATLIGGYLTPLVVALAQRIPGNDLPIAAQLYTLACAAGYVAFRHFGDAIDAGAERFHKLIKPNTGKS